jgi:hypothetical protein
VRSGKPRLPRSPLRGAALIPLPGPRIRSGAGSSPAGAREGNRGCRSGEPPPLRTPSASTTAPPEPPRRLKLRTARTSAPLENTATPARSPAGALRWFPLRDGGDGAPVGAVRSGGGGSLRRRMPRGTRASRRPVKRCCLGPGAPPGGPAGRRAFLALVAAGATPCACPEGPTLPPPSRRPGTPLVVAAGGFTQDPPGEGERVSASRGSPPSTPRAPVRLRLRPSEWTGGVCGRAVGVSRIIFLRRPRRGRSAVGSRQWEVGSGP